MEHLNRDLWILSINESEEDEQEVIKHLDVLGCQLHCTRVSTFLDFQDELKKNHWTFILSISNNLSIHREALIETKLKFSDLPFILIAKQIGEEDVADMIRAGAEDVVILSRAQRLPRVVRRVMREKDVKSKEAKAIKIAHAAYAAREQMLAVVSHDIKNPLSAIQLEAQMLLKMAERHAQTPLAQTVSAQAGRILKTTNRLKELIANLLDKNKTEDGLSCLEKSDSDISSILQEVLDTLRPLIREKNISIKSVSPQESIVLLDKSKIFQVLSNLLNNSIKFTPVNGCIRVEIQDHETEFIFLVSDSGPGLKESDCNRIFEKYWTGHDVKGLGTGLGLFICKTIVEAHGGRIHAENGAEGGARFIFTLPKPSGSLTASYWSKDERPKILVLDDDEDLREVICWALGNEGYAVHSYSDPHMALEGLRLGHYIPQLIIVDFHMDGMMGSEFVKYKAAIDAQDVKNCPVLMMSASPEEVLLAVSTEHYKKIFSKPLDLEALVSDIKVLVH